MIIIFSTFLFLVLVLNTPTSSIDLRSFFAGPLLYRPPLYHTTSPKVSGNAANALLSNGKRNLAVENVRHV
ncbi:MAG: hypothetical protein ACI8RD_012045 [Bacillariaceae sp.]|jgi:hypothetical protein